MEKKIDETFNKGEDFTFQRCFSDFEEEAGISPQSKNKISNPNTEQPPNNYQNNFQNNNETINNNIDKNIDNNLDKNINNNKNKNKDNNIDNNIENNINFNNNNINNNEKEQEIETPEIKMEKLRKTTENAIKSTVRNRSNSNFIKSLVSQDKNRFCFDGYDLDLTYITPNIIAMGLPSTSLEGLYRNNMNDVVNFFNHRHSEHYKVYNLCEEKKYPPNIFYQQGYFPFQDHEAPPLNLIRPFCEDAKSFLDSDPKNVVAIHCLAGKGRTGTLISCLLLYLGYFETAADCLKYYGSMRVENGRGVTVPSQIRYVFYFEQIIKNKIPHPIIFKSLCIKSIRMITIPNLNKVGSGCSPTFSVENKVDGKKNVFNYWNFVKKRETYEENVPFAIFELGDEGFNVNGDVKITFFQTHVFGGREKVFKMWFNTNFVPDDGVLEIKKDLIDKACKDKDCKRYKQNFKIEIHTIDLD